MNKRIKDLAVQAKLPNYVLEPGTELCLAPHLQAFAELLIQDAIDIVSAYTVRMNKPGEEYMHPIQELQQHFGIK